MPNALEFGFNAIAVLDSTKVALNLDSLIFRTMPLKPPGLGLPLAHPSELIFIIPIGVRFHLTNLLVIMLGKLTDKKEKLNSLARCLLFATMAAGEVSILLKIG